jgi:tetratricopeptide (TPR) repeat protein
LASTQDAIFVRGLSGYYFSNTTNDQLLCNLRVSLDYNCEIIAMNRCNLLLCFFVSVLSLFSYSQVCDQRSGAPMQMQVQLTFGDTGASGTAVPTPHDDSIHRGDAPGVDHAHNFVPEMQIHIQLQDPSGGTLQETIPTSDGQVRLAVCKNLNYRLRVTGPEIEEAILDSLQPGRGDRLVTVVLHRKLTKEERKAQAATISAQRLQVPKKAQKALEKGDAALRSGKVEQAKKHYQKAIKIYPNFEEAENDLGIIAMREGNKVEGRAAFVRALNTNPHYAPAQVNLAKIAFDEKRYNDAYLLAKQALSSEPLNSGALFVAAESAFFKGDYAETVSFTRTLHSLPHQPYSLAHFLAAKSLEAQHQPSAALSEYQTFLDEDPTDPNAARARQLIALLQVTTAGPK